MNNYKPFNDWNIQIGGANVPIPAGGEIVGLWSNNAGSNAPLSMDRKPGVNYTVDTGKNLTIIGGWVNAGTANQNVKFYEGDTDDAITSLKGQIQTIVGTCWFYQRMTFTAGKYVTTDPSSSATLVCYLIGFEMDENWSYNQ